MALFLSRACKTWLAYGNVFRRELKLERIITVISVTSAHSTPTIFCFALVVKAYVFIVKQKSNQMLSLGCWR
jgi:hypothetical protein